MVFSVPRRQAQLYVFILTICGHKNNEAFHLVFIHRKNECVISFTPPLDLILSVINETNVPCNLQYVI